MFTTDRRRFLGYLSGTTAALAGCSGGSSDAPYPVDADVIAGPKTRATFDPKEISVSTGETVTWYFDSRGHNVSCRPGDSEKARLPDGADPFASYGPDESPGTTRDAGETYSHTFSVPGTYVYVCIPHVTAGMIGHVRVEA